MKAKVCVLPLLVMWSATGLAASPDDEDNDLMLKLVEQVAALQVELQGMRNDLENQRQQREHLEAIVAQMQAR